MAGFITAVQAEHANEAEQSDKVISDKFEAGTDILGDGLDGMLVKDSGGTAQVKIGEGASGGKASINEDGKVQELQDESSSIVEAAKTLLKLNQVKVGKDALGTDLEGIEIQNDSGTPVVQLGELSSGVYGLKATEGEFELVTSNLTIGKDALGSGLAGINVNDKILIGELSNGTYGLQVEDQSGRTIFDSNGKFLPLPNATDLKSKTNSGRMTGNAWTTMLSLSNSDVILGGQVAKEEGDTNDIKDFQIKITDDSGASTISHPPTINDSEVTGYGSTWKTGSWALRAMQLPIPTLQVQGSATLEVYNAHTDKRNWQIKLWYY